MTPSAEEFLAELRSDLHAFGRLTEALAEREDLKPRPSSRAADEWGSARRADIHEAYSSADLLIASAGDYLEGLARILMEELPERSVLLLCRGVVETSVRAWWLLDPDITTEERARRGVLERLHNVSETATIKKALKDEGKSASPEPEQDTAPTADTIVAQARAHGHLVTKKSHRYELDGRGRPSPTRLLKLYDEISGEFVYRFLSASAHATTYALLQGMDAEVPAGEWEGGLLLKPNASFGTMAMMLTTSVLAFCDAFDRKLLLYGWPRDEWRAWTQHALSRLRRHLPQE